MGNETPQSVDTAALRSAVAKKFKAVYSQLPGVNCITAADLEMLTYASEHALLSENGRPEMAPGMPWISIGVRWIEALSTGADLFTPSIGLPMVTSAAGPIHLDNIPVQTEPDVNMSLGQLLEDTRGGLDQENPLTSLLHWRNKPIPRINAICYAPIPEDGSFVPMIYFTVAVRGQARAFFVINNGEPFPGMYIVSNGGGIMYPSKDGHKAEFISLGGVTAMDDAELRATQGVGNRGFFDIIAIPVQDPSRQIMQLPPQHLLNQPKDVDMLQAESVYLSVLL